MRRDSRKKRSLEIRRDMCKYASDIMKSKNFLSSSKNIQHGRTSVMKHSMKVAYFSMAINRRMRFNCVEDELVRGALLHDYFLYDWHDDEHCGLSNLHGFYHPSIALRNARKEYTLTPREEDIIKKHMWPLTIKTPLCREAWVVTMADKYVSLIETFKRKPPVKVKDK